MIPYLFLFRSILQSRVIILLCPPPSARSPLAADGMLRLSFDEPLMNASRSAAHAGFQPTTFSGDTPRAVGIYALTHRLLATYRQDVFPAIGAAIFPMWAYCRRRAARRPSAASLPPKRRFRRGRYSASIALYRYYRGARLKALLFISRRIFPFSFICALGQPITIIARPSPPRALLWAALPPASSRLPPLAAVAAIGRSIDKAKPGTPQQPSALSISRADDFPRRGNINR